MHSKDEQKAENYNFTQQILYAQSCQTSVFLGPIIHCLRGGTKQRPVQATLKGICLIDVSFQSNCIIVHRGLNSYNRWL